MDRMLFVNLPVEDVQASRAFYTGLGFSVNEMFSDDRVACIVVSETIFVMALEHERFADFVTTPIADARTSTQVLNALSCASRAEVDDLATRALANGGSEYRPSSDENGMYARAVTDPDGHVWELVHMAMPAEA